MAPPGFVVAYVSRGPFILWPGGEVPFEPDAHDVFMARQPQRRGGAAAPGPGVGEEGDDDDAVAPRDVEAEDFPDEEEEMQENAESEVDNDPYNDFLQLLASIDEPLEQPAVLHPSSSSSDSSSSSSSSDSSSSSSSTEDNGDDEQRNPEPPPPQARPDGEGLVSSLL